MASMLDYYVYKARNVLLTKLATPLADRRAGPGLLCGRIGPFRFDNRIVFYFADPELVHLGDQLFHQPLINHWRSDFDIRVAVSGPFSDYFAGQGLPVIGPDDYASVSGAIVITKNDLAFAVNRRFPNGNYFVGVNYHLVADPGPICLALARAVYDALEPLHLGLPALPSEQSAIYAPYVPRALAEGASSDWAEPIVREPGCRWLAYNDYVSSNHLSASRRMGVIQDMARQLKREGCKIVYVGSDRERAHRPGAPDFVDLDLRGRFGPIELYRLFALNNVAGVVCFDTFVMHVASALRKDLYVVRKSTGYPEGYRRKYVPMYPGADEIVKAYE
jgi:hypothetical protein